ncbi:MAG: response regulator [Oscillospiraceae bacterium]|nr:response regulator [Oscillospiraceae bacterium]
MAKTVFVVDDNDVNLISAESSLIGSYNVFTLASAVNMFELLEDVTPDLILLDIEMPDMDGFEALRRLKSGAYADIPVIFLTGRNDSITEALGFDLGAVDFVTKPFSEPVLLKRIKSHLDIESLVRERTSKLLRLQHSMVSVLANMVESRDELTGSHIVNTTNYIKLLLSAMKERNVYTDEINTWNEEMIISSARLHDIGKVKISDSILNKKGSLTTEEFEIMKTHAEEGEKFIDGIIEESGDEVFLHNAKLFAGCHHERWDGSGYPRGLKGEYIPLQGRIMAIADVYDALVSERPYKLAFSHEKAVGIIAESKGKHFDPTLVDVFMEINDMFAEVKQSL